MRPARLAVTLAAMVAAAAACAAAAAAAAAADHDAGQGNNCQGEPNLLPIYEGKPDFVKAVPNGKLYQTGAADLGARINVVHMYGTPYDMGFAHGTLLKEEIADMYGDMLEWIYGQVGEQLHSLPKWLQELIEKDGIAAALEATYWLTKPYIPVHFIEEVSGLSNATGLDFDYVMRIQLFPSLIQASCSMMGAWGEAVQDVGGSLYQLRALDWGTTSPMARYPAVLVYHPLEGHDFTTVSWAGWIGALTGYSSADVAICEKVWIHYKGSKPRAGEPWHFVLRDILQYDRSAAEGLSRLENAHRTCSIFVGLGDSSPVFHAVEYSHDIVHAFNDSNFPAPHPEFTDVVYVDKHTQPSADPCMPSLIKEHYGSLNATTIFQQITPQFETGNLHLAVFDFARQAAYISNSAPPTANTTEPPAPAYKRPFTRVDLAALFAEKQ